MTTRGPAPEWLTLLNTSLILVSGVFLLIGYYFIRRRQIELQKRSTLTHEEATRRDPAWFERQIEFHKRSMLTATTFAALFLVVYVSRALLFETKAFAGDGMVRVLYLGILISHTILATLVGPFALITLRRALKGDYVRHKKIARITFPMWLYVVVTGWIIYWMLHNLSVEMI